MAGQGQIQGGSFVLSSWWELKSILGRGAGRMEGEAPCQMMHYIQAPFYPLSLLPMTDAVSVSLSEDSGTEPSCQDSRHCEWPRRLDEIWWEMSSRRETTKELNLRPELNISRGREGAFTSCGQHSWCPTVMPVCTEPFHREPMFSGIVVDGDKQV